MSNEKKLLEEVAKVLENRRKILLMCKARAKKYGAVLFANKAAELDEIDALITRITATLSAPEPDAMKTLRQKVKDVVEYAISDGKGYNGVSGEVENKINTALDEVDGLFDGVKVEE